MKNRVIILVGIILLLILGAVCFAPKSYLNENDSLFLYTNNEEYKTSKIELNNNLLSENDFLIGYDNNKLYIGRFDKIFKIISYNMNSGQIDDSIYETNVDITISYANFLNEAIYIGETSFGNETIDFVLKRIDVHGNVIVLMNEQVDKMPYINNNDNFIFVNYSNMQNNIKNSYVESINIDTFKHEVIDERHSNITSDGLYKGDMIIYCGGLDEILYYQVVTLNNEVVETGGHVSMYAYSLQNNTTQELPFLKNKVIYISGDEKNVITSEYSYEQSNVKTGKIYSLTEGESLFQKIPYISPGLDIMESRMLDNDKIVMYNIDGFYVYNTSNKTFNYERYKKISNGNYSLIKFYKNSLGYIERANEKLYFYNIYIK